MANATRSADIGYGRINAFGFTGHVPYLITQVSGPHIDAVKIMAEQQSVASPDALNAWLVKLEHFGPALAGVIEKLKADEAAGCRPPQILLDGALPVIDAFLAAPGERHPLIVALRTRMAAAALDAQRMAGVEARAIQVLERYARPAFARLRGHIAHMQGRTEPGLWAQPDGEALYAANVRALGDTKLTPAEIHALGQSEVARISAIMHGKLVARGLSHHSVGARMAHIAADPRNLFADSETGRAQALDNVRAHVRAMEGRYPLFLPRELIPHQPLKVQRTPALTQAGAPSGFYDGPSLDGGRAGTIWINLADMTAMPRFRLPTLAFHEGVPGHHTQNSVALAAGERPLLLRIASFNAYQEGWAVYAEQLAAELGGYARDPIGDLGRLQDELFRAVRLVADTGLHAMRWSREQAIAYMRDTTGTAESRVTAEVERYMAWPGQALGYKLGQLRLLAMRDRLRARKGRGYNLRAFHAAVLTHGAMPLDLVEQAVGEL
jgi:uncharacterized protein (DUF885 family)